MGLDVSHNAWSGAYSAFSRWRDALAKAAGYTLATLEGDYRETILIDWGHVVEKNYYGDWDTPPTDPLILLIAHSDCEGQIKVEHLAALADRLDELAPLLEGQDGGGHLGNTANATRRFANACRTALAANEPLEFS